ncbi:MAG: glycerol-3-phosphate 1-O-acyltransferase PlsY [Bdellovibrionales bacterium]
MIAYLISLLVTYGPMALVAYLIGSIPFGLLLSRFFLKQDIRKIGSGNIGATNVLRSGNKWLAFFTLILDGGKGALAIGLFYFSFAHSFNPSFNALLCGLFAILGHCFPLWLKFKGGKGVATALGVFLAAVPIVGGLACAIWLASAFIFKISSLAALIAIGSAPIVTFLLYGSGSSVVCLFITLLVFWRHKENIQRLLTGDEPKISRKKKE